MSTAETSKPLFHKRHNSVPPPPQSYSGFQPSGQIPSDLVHVEMSLHHHIDTCFGALFRMTTDNTDKIIDKVVGRLEDVQDTLSKGLKGMKAEIRDTRKEVGTILRETKAAMQANEITNRSMKAVEAKLGALELKIDELGLRRQQFVTEAELVENATFSQMHSNASSRRSESADPTLTRNGRLQHYQSGSTQSLGGTHQSLNSSRGRWPNTANSATWMRDSNERGVRREFFSDIIAARGPVPDIRSHPAFATRDEEFDVGSFMYQTPLIRDTWYQESF